MKNLFAMLSCAALIALAAAPVAKAESALAGSKPNVILIMTDDQGYGPVARHGHSWIETPNMDRMFDSSTRFTRFLVSPTCSPTRSAIMTGRHPMRNGITHTILERERLNPELTTLPQFLKKAGYTTGIFGKWHLGDEEDHQPHNRGFDEAFIHGAGGIGQAYNCSCADVPGNSYFNPTVRHNGTFKQTEGFCTDVFFTAARGWINEKREGDQPFFAYIVTNAPHGPFLAPDPDKKRFLDMGFTQSEAGFYGMIENIDDNLGKLLDNLKDWELLENTVVIFMSDNGTTGGGSGKLGKVIGTNADGDQLYPYNAGMKGLKGSPDEGGVRVPFFIRWDGHFTPGVAIDRIAAHIDILPTLCELAGVEVPEMHREGRSLLPLIEDPNLAAEWPDRYLYTHVGRWPTGADPDKFQWQKFAVRNQRFRLVGENQLFDMVADPGQTTNVFDQHPEVVQQMKDSYDAWWKDTRKWMVNEETPLSKTRPFHVLYNEQKSTTGIPNWQAPVFE